jgi:C4-type Zn-finger protein
MTLYDLSERAALIAQAVGDQETDEQMDAFDAFVEEFEADAGQKAQATLYVLDALGATAQRLKDQAKIITAKARAAESNAARLKERLKSLLMDIELTGSAALIELPEGTKLRLG